MNRKKIARLTSEIDGVTINSTKEIEVLVLDEDGDKDFDATENAKEAAQNALGWGGFTTGYGAWVLQENFRPIMGDWNDKASEHHY